MTEEPPELQAASAQVRAALQAGWEPTDTDQYWLGQVYYTLGTYLDLSGEWTTGHFEVWQQGLEMYSDVGKIRAAVSGSFARALAADLSPVVRNLLRTASTWEPIPLSQDIPWRRLAWSLVSDEFNPY
jgi:hypothetical protein